MSVVSLLIALTATSSLPPSPAPAGGGSALVVADTIALSELEVTGRNSASKRLADGNILFDGESMRRGMRVLGEADVLSSLKQLPGVTFASELGSGVVVNGSDPSTTLFSIDGAPLFFPYRFGGVFSALNTSHFSSTLFSRTSHNASFASRTGAGIDMLTPTNIPTRPEGYASLGLIASSATFRLPLTRKFCLNFSGRASYLDEIYGRLLKGKTSQVKYRFQDYNVTGIYTPTDRDRIALNLFCGNDRLVMDDPNLAMDFGIRWNNSLASLNWKHRGAVDTEVRAWHTRFSNRVLLDMAEFEISMPSAIAQSGMFAEVSSRKFSERMGNVSGGIELNYNDVHPQYVDLTGLSIENVADRRHQKALEGRAFADWHFEPVRNLKIDLGFSGSLYRSRDVEGNNISDNQYFTTFSPSPRTTLRFSSRAGEFKLHYGYYTQYLHQTGFTDIGLASDFWSASSVNLPPLRANSMSLGWMKRVWNESITLEAELYGRLMRGMAEYEGDVVSLLYNGYDSSGGITSSCGFAYGLNLSATKELGDIYGRIAYSWGTVRRHSPAGMIFSILDPGNSLHLNAGWRINDHWTVDGSFNLASGRRYTPVRALFVIASNMLCVYGTQNSARFATYHRLDLSATYSFRTGGRFPLRHFVNLSLLNAYGHKNQEAFRYKIDTEEQTIVRVQLNSIYRFIPSLNYAIEF